MKTTAGIILLNSDHTKVCVVHPRGAPANQWSIPKGEPDHLEAIMGNYLAAAIREFGEETMTEISDLLPGCSPQEGNFTELGEFPYAHRNKMLIAFGAVAFVEPWADGVFSEHDNFEVDQARWAPIWVAGIILHDTQQKALVKYLKYLDDNE